MGALELLAPLHKQTTCLLLFSQKCQGFMSELQRAGWGNPSLCQRPNSAWGPSRTGSVLVLAIAAVSLHTSSQRRGRVRSGVTCRITEDEARDKVTPITEKTEKRAPGNDSTYQRVTWVKSCSFRAAQRSLEMDWRGAGSPQGQGTSSRNQHSISNRAKTFVLI